MRNAYFYVLFFALKWTQVSQKTPSYSLRYLGDHWEPSLHKDCISSNLILTAVTVLCILYVPQILPLQRSRIKKKYNRITMSYF